MAATEKALEENERRLQQQQPEEQPQEQPEPVGTRLRRLQAEAAELQLAQRAAAYAQEYNSSSNHKPEVDDLQRLNALGDLLLLGDDDGPPVASSPLYRQLYRDEFVPLLAYVRTERVRTLRHTLQHGNYPADCEELLRQSEMDDDDADDDELHTIVSCCDALRHLQRLQERVVAHVEQRAAGHYYDDDDDVNVPPSSSTLDPVLAEFCRPIAERIRYHFVEAAPDRPTTTRIDRLPEWLLQYLRQHVFQSGGAWELVYYGLPSTSDQYSNNLAIDFLNEILRMVQWVLGERQFFRHPAVAGPNSQPLVLCHAVEQLLQFDEFCQRLLVDDDENDDSNVRRPKNRQILSLFDACVAGDEELLAWWLERERESVFSTLARSSEDDNNDFTTQAELFAALMRSVQRKAAVFSFSGPYWRQVAAPLCVRYTDGVQEAAGDLKRLLLTPAAAASSSLRHREQQAALRPRFGRERAVLDGTHWRDAPGGVHAAAVDGNGSNRCGDD